MKFYELILKLYCSFFFMGYSPLAPGTVGTMGAVLVFYIFAYMSPLYYLTVIIVFTLISIFLTNKTLRFYNSDDPGEIVIDEVCGYLFAMFLIPFSWSYVFIGFILFRLFDITKPYPIRNIERLPAGYGIILDDILAGIYANIILHLFVLFL